jgi:transposase
LEAGRNEEVSSFKYGVVNQSVLTEQRTDVPLPNENISIPFGLVRTIEHYLGAVGVLGLLDTFKERGVPLSRIAVAVCTCILMGSNSMSRCADWLSDPNVMREMGFKNKVSQKTINRAVEIIGDHADEIIAQFWKGLDSRYCFDNTDVNIDGSAVVFNGPMSELGEIGHPRDFKDQSRPQVEFMTAQLQGSGIPFFIRMFPGNTSDAEQYRDVLPEVFRMIREGSWIIMDNGGAAGDILDSIVRSGNRYLTRVKMNSSDDLWISEHKGKWEYVEEGVCCMWRTFVSSGRTVYLFRSVDNTIRSYNAAERRVHLMVDAARSYESGKFNPSDFVTVKKNLALESVDLKMGIQTRFGYDDPEEIERMIEDEMGIRSGIFKLESSAQLTPAEALGKYRARSAVEHLIHSLKRITGLKPMRVWKLSSIKGSAVLALLSEAAMAMARYELEPKPVTTTKKGKKVIVERRPATDSMVWSLTQLTVCRIVEKGRRKGAVYSNWNPVARGVFDNIRHGFRRRPASADG